MLPPPALCALLAAAALSFAGAFSSPPRPSSRAHRSGLALSAAGLAAAPPTYSALFGLAARRALRNQPPLFSIPSIFSPADSRPVVLFDGKCNLCNAGVQLILDHDRAASDPRGHLRVAALQSRVGRVLLARLPAAQRATVLNLSDKGGGATYKSIVVAGEGRTWLNSAACLRIGREMRGPLRFLALLAGLVPAVIRDPVYRLLSRHRTRLFGEAPGCRLWDENWDTRFVDDALFGGRSGEVDPFADPNAPVQEEEEWEGEEAPPGTPPLRVGDSVRVTAARPILHTHVRGHDGGLCSVGLVGTVRRVLGRRAYPKNVVVHFDVPGAAAGGATAFDAHFFPGQLRREGP